MNKNSQQLLNHVLIQQRQDRAAELSEQEYFEIFSAEQILKNFQLSYDDLQSGVVDGEHDGGIDSVYAFVNGELVYEDIETKKFKGNVHVELHIIQSKTSGGFSEASVNRLISATRHLLDLDADYSKLTQYNDAVKASLDNFRQTYLGLAAKFPSLKIRYYYASKSAAADIHANLKKKGEELEGVARTLFSEADVVMEFLGARRLLELARTRPETTYTLKVKKNLSDVDGYIVLTPLSSYAEFIKKSNGGIKAELFESNVRDFQGITEVNKEIANTLRNETVVDFWWMNNGVTILASRATLSGDAVTIENPQIVNGLQTSKQIAGHLDADPDDHRSVMVKIVSSEDEETRDKIIKATNSQNRIQPASLRATDKVQRDIEDTLKASNLYYDRRKNFYKNEGKPRDRIIAISLMAQAIMSMILARPDSARARPSSLIKNDEAYYKIFSAEFPLTLYANAAALIRRVQIVLRTRSEMTPRDRTNVRFYVLYWLAGEATAKVKPTPSDVGALDLGQIADDDIEEAIDTVWVFFDGLGRSDDVAKGVELIEELKNELRFRLEKEKSGASS